MITEQLIGKFARLRIELIDARARRIGARHLERLMDELSETRLILAELMAPSDEQTGDSQFMIER